MSKIKKKAILLIMLCIIVALTATFGQRAVASDSDNDQIDDSVENEQQRQIRIEREDDTRVEIKSQIERQGVENEFRVRFRTEEAVRLDLSFSKEANATETELEVSVRFQQLMEFVDQNGDGLPSAGETVQTVDLTAETFSSPTVTATTSEDGESGFNIESHVIGEDFTFQVVATVFPTFAVVNETVVKPTETKVTVVINDFPFKNNGSIALTVKVESEKEIEQDSEGSEQEVKVTSTEAEGFFSWSTQATVDGTAKEVKSTVVNDGDDKKITLAYPNGQQITHDPKLGVNLTSDAAGILPAASANFLVVAAVVALAIVGAIALLMIRRRKS